MPSWPFGARPRLGDAVGQVGERERRGGVADEPLVRRDGLGAARQEVVRP